MSLLTAGHFKQELIKQYNHINLRMFGIGVKRQKVDIVGDKVMILAEHKRIPSLKYLDKEHRLITRLTDITIIDAFKKQLKETLEETYHMKVLAILKDYDPETEYSITVVILDKQADQYLSGVDN
ncbi:Na-translocating system protein MpsC family protein [Bacillus tianshenii]|nr:Na-translocating system protein MpsC family protein [Bacillus tianshenii]